MKHTIHSISMSATKREHIAIPVTCTVIENGESPKMDANEMNERKIEIENESKKSEEMIETKNGSMVDGKQECSASEDGEPSISTTEGRVTFV